MSGDGLVASLAAAQAEFTTLTKGRKAKVPTKTGGSYEYTYVDIGDVLDMVIPVLTKHGIALLQPVQITDSGAVLQTLLLKGGDRLESEMPLDLRGMQPQAVGSLLTYYRRYTLLSMLSLAAEDDDGKTAQNTPRRTRTEPDRLAPEQVQAVTDWFDGLPDDERKARKQAFVAEFGQPTQVEASKWLLVEKWMSK